MSLLQWPDPLFPISGAFWTKPPRCGECHDGSELPCQMWVDREEIHEVIDKAFESARAKAETLFEESQK